MLLIGLGIGLFFRLVDITPGFVLLFVLAIGLVFGLFLGPLLGLSREQLTKRSILSPNEGIQRSTKNGLRITLGFGLVVVLVFMLAIGLFGMLPSLLFYGLFIGLLVGPSAGLVYGLLFGLSATIKHYTLRFWLWRARCMPTPWHTVSFLDDAVEQLLLRKIGGGYIFRHRLLQDYFASLDVVPPHDPSVGAEAHPVVQNAPDSDPSV